MKYIKYVLKNTQPLRITEDSTSRQGQTATLSYIPGSSIRGYVISRFAADGDETFEKFRKQLLSDSCRFMNAYIALPGKTLIPAPKGFYGDKTDADDKVYHNVVVDPDLPDGLKRASAGEFVVLDGDTVRGCSVRKGSDLKIKINSRNEARGNDSLFRNDYMASGQCFAGYIAVDDDELAKEIVKRFGDTVRLGNSRSSGYGECKVTGLTEEDDYPYDNYAVQNDQNGNCYMMLLSDTVMRNDEGEYCGISEAALGRLLGNESLSIENCSTSIKDVRGFNRTWQSSVPSLRMFEKGSVFKLCYTGTVSIDTMKSVMKRGIGVRRNEGFGQVIFLKDYAELKYMKELGESAENGTNVPVSEAEDKQVIRQIAREYLKILIEEGMTAAIPKDKFGELKSASKSQLGTLEALVSYYRYDPLKGIDEAGKLFAHSRKKEESSKVHKEKKTISGTDVTFISSIIEPDLFEVLEIKGKADRNSGIMGIPVRDLITREEEAGYKLELISRIIRFSYKEVPNGKK